MSTARIQCAIKFFFLIIIIPLNCKAFNNETNSSHLDAIPCSQCHVSNSNISAENAGLLVDSQSSLCSRCHTGAEGINHPFNFRPEKNLPPDFPLDNQNRMTCSTCHDVHGDSAGLLRTEMRGMEFCQSCHKQEFFLSMKDQGTSLITSTHLNIKKYNNSSELDPFSIQCLGCHNDSNYSLQDEIYEGSVMHKGMMSGNHQIGVVYSDYKTFGGYKSQEMLDKEIILPQGKLSCISCHKGYSKKHGSLVMNNSGSSLCYGCHEI